MGSADPTAQRDALLGLGLGVEAERIYVDHGVTGTNRERPGAARPGRARGGEWAGAGRRH